MADAEDGPPNPDDPCLINVPQQKYESLSLEDYKQLPDTMKAYEGRAQNDFLNVTPPILKFPHDDPSRHFAKLVIWNKSKHQVEFRIQKPSTSFFTVFFEKNHLFGGTEETLTVHCKPRGQKLCSDCIRIQLMGIEAELIVIPLELLPSSKWFVLPKIIVMPVIPIGRSYDVNIYLPEPPMTEEALYFYVSDGNTDTLTVTPSEGYVGGQPSATTVYTGFLTLSYHPKEYLSLAYSFSLNFPQMEYMEPYEITVYLRCIPGYESEIILRSIEQLTIPHELSTPVKKPRSVMTKLKPRKLEIPNTPPIPNLSTQAAVMKFLLQPADKMYLPRGNEPAVLGGVSSTAQQRVYKRKEREFHDRLNQIYIQQHGMHLQPTKPFIGDDAIELDAQLYESVRAEREQHLLDYQKLRGLFDDDIEDLTRTKLKLSRQRCIRNVDESYIPEQMKNSTAKLHFLSVDSTNPLQWAKLERLRRFVQAVRLVITQARAQKRIVKLRILIRDKKRERLEEAKEKARISEATRLEEELKSLRKFSSLEEPAAVDGMAMGDRKDSESGRSMDFSIVTGRSGGSLTSEKDKTVTGLSLGLEGEKHHGHAHGHGKPAGGEGKKSSMASSKKSKII